MAKKNSNKVEQIINDKRAEIVREFIETIENCEGDKWQIPWNAGMNAYNPFNSDNSGQYRGRNRIHTWWSAYKNGYTDNRWCTYKQAAEHGMTLKPEQKYTLTEVWRPVKIYGENEDTGERELKFTYYKPIAYHRVYNFDQFEDEGKPEAPKRVEHDDDFNSVIDDIESKWICPITEMVHHRGAFYRPATHEIKLPDRTLFNDKYDFASTLLHEMVHSTGHESVLNRPNFNDWDDDSYAFEELVAELGSVFASIELGFDVGERSGKHHRQHAAYLKSWAKHLKDTPKALFDAAGLAQSAADYIVNTVNGAEEVQPEEVKQAA